MHRSLTLAALTRSAGAVAAAPHGMTSVGTASAERVGISRCQEDHGYGAANIRLGNGHGIDAKNVQRELYVLPGDCITCIVEQDISARATSRLSVRPVRPVPKARHPASMTQRCPPRAPRKYRGTFYCPKQ